MGSLTGQPILWDHLSHPEEKIRCTNDRPSSYERRRGAAGRPPEATATLQPLLGTRTTASATISRGLWTRHTPRQDRWIGGGYCGLRSGLGGGGMSGEHTTDGREGRFGRWRTAERGRTARWLGRRQRYPRGYRDGALSGGGWGSRRRSFGTGTDFTLCI